MKGTDEMRERVSRSGAVDSGKQVNIQKSNHNDNGSTMRQKNFKKYRIYDRRSYYIPYTVD